MTLCISNNKWVNVPFPSIPLTQKYQINMYCIELSSIGPKLMQEMKDRFREKHGVSYVEPEPKCRLQSALQTDQPTLPKIEKALEDVQSLIPLSINLSNDLSHILPSVLKVLTICPIMFSSHLVDDVLFNHKIFLAVGKTETTRKVTLTLR